MGALGALHRMDGCFGGQSPPRVHSASGIRHPASATRMDTPT